MSLCGVHLVLQATISDRGAFDPFSLQQDFLAASEVDVGWREVTQASVITAMVLILDEGGDLGFEIARKIIVFQQDAVLERLMPTLDFSLRL